MKFIIGDSVAKAAAEGAELVAAWSREAVAERGRFVVALSGGESPKALYQALRGRRDVEWRRWEVFFGDERAVSAQDPRSNLLSAWKAAGRCEPEGYSAGSWGPSEANELIARDGRRWRSP